MKKDELTKEQISKMMAEAVKRELEIDEEITLGTKLSQLISNMGEALNVLWFLFPIEKLFSIDFGIREVHELAASQDAEFEDIVEMVQVKLS